MHVFCFHYTSLTNGTFIQCPFAKFKSAWQGTEGMALHPLNIMKDENSFCEQGCPWIEACDQHLIGHQVLIQANGPFIFIVFRQGILT